MQLSASVKTSLGTANTPSCVAVTGIDAAQPFCELLTDANSPVRTRVDPEYFLTANSPYVYYSLYVPPTSTTPGLAEGEYYISMQRGPLAEPSGTAE